MPDPLSSGFFSPLYGDWQRIAALAGESREMPESGLQALWRDRAFPGVHTTLEGHRIRIVSPGWWNRLKGPDFINAQVEFNETLVTGDVEIHGHGRDWYQHGHHQDPAYERVILHAVETAGTIPAVTLSGRPVATWVFPQQRIQAGYTGVESTRACGECAKSQAHRMPDLLERFLDLAGEWRMLEKSRRVLERMKKVSGDQALYEAFLTACGYSAFKEPFRAIAEALPYERARQLACQDPLALEAAYLRLAGLLPEPWPYETAPPPHYQKLIDLYHRYLHPLAILDFSWKGHASRPANRPERRLAGMARFIARTAARGMTTTLDLVWRPAMSPEERQEGLAELFGNATGFWSRHTRWQSEESSRAEAPLGQGRILSIIGNVFIPAALAAARFPAPDPVLERHVHELFAALPCEPDNRIYRTMMRWIVPEGVPLKMGFRRQQGLLQIHTDWCGHDPSCQNCILPVYLDTLERALGENPG